MLIEGGKNNENQDGFTIEIRPKRGLSSIYGRLKLESFENCPCGGIFDYSYNNRTLAEKFADTARDMGHDADVIDLVELDYAHVYSFDQRRSSGNG